MARNEVDVILMQKSRPARIGVIRIRCRSLRRLPIVLESFEGLKVAYSMDFSYRRVDPEVRSNTLAAIDLFRNLGCQVNEVDLGWSSDHRHGSAFIGST